LFVLPGSVQVTHTLRAASTLVAGEPEGPTVKTDIPGPKSRQLLAELNALQVNGSVICLQSRISFLSCFENELIKNHVSLLKADSVFFTK
jgi:hypothetical protein